MGLADLPLRVRKSGALGERPPRRLLLGRADCHIGYNRCLTSLVRLGGYGIDDWTLPAELSLESASW